MQPRSAELHKTTGSRTYAGKDNAWFGAFYHGDDSIYGGAGTPAFGGWEGKPGWWHVEDGAITAESTPEKPCTKCHYLIWRGGEPADFELRCAYRLVGDNSGIQFRSRALPDFDMAGYQADMEDSPRRTGELYDCNGRGTMTLRGQKVVIDESGKRTVTSIGSSAELQKHVKLKQWNEYRVIARGSEITLMVNGIVMSRTIDREREKAASRGLIGFQMHVGPPMKVQFKNIRIKNLD